MNKPSGQHNKQKMSLIQWFDSVNVCLGCPKLAHHEVTVGQPFHIVQFGLWFIRRERGPGAYIVSIEEQLALLCVRVEKEKESLGLLCDPGERMFPLFMHRRIHLSVAIKWLWLCGFQLSRFVSLKETLGNILKASMREKEGLDKMLQRYSRPDLEKSAWETELLF